MNTDYKAILEQEIAALKREMTSNADPARRGAAQKCYDIVSQPLYAPKSYPDIVRAVSRIITETTHEAPGLEEIGASALANLIILRAALVLRLLVDNARKSLLEFYETIKVEDAQKLNMYINTSGSTAQLLSSVHAHRTPLDLLVNKSVRIQGDPFDEMIEFVRKLELSLKKYRKEGTFEAAVAGGDDPVVEQAFQRIVRGVTAIQSHKRQQQLAEKCVQLKALFPDAANQIDKMFRKEAESLDDL